MDRSACKLDVHLDDRRPITLSRGPYHDCTTLHDSAHALAAGHIAVRGVGQVRLEILEGREQVCRRMIAIHDVVIEDGFYQRYIFIRERRTNDGIVHRFRKCGIGGRENGDRLIGCLS